MGGALDASYRALSRARHEAASKKTRTMQVIEDPLQALRNPGPRSIPQKPKVRALFTPCAEPCCGCCCLGCVCMLWPCSCVDLRWFRVFVQGSGSTRPGLVPCLCCKRGRTVQGFAALGRDVTSRVLRSRKTIPCQCCSPWVGLYRAWLNVPPAAAAAGGEHCELHLRLSPACRFCSSESELFLCSSLSLRAGQELQRSSSWSARTSHRPHCRGQNGPAADCLSIGGQVVIVPSCLLVRMWWVCPCHLLHMTGCFPAHLFV